MQEAKEAVRAFWGRQSCGEVYAEGDSPQAQFAAQAEARYHLEPYLRPFARFDGRGKDVLEIGVGMGADHIEWARSEPHRLVGIDFTRRAVDWTAERMGDEGLDAQVLVADAENLPFEDESFDLVYSWGVLHHTPNTVRAFQEVRRVLRPGGTVRAMVYHRPSIVGALLWIRYALLAGHPRDSISDMYAAHLESPGTKGYTVDEGRGLVEAFTKATVRPQVSLGDLLEGAVGQQHESRLLRAAKAVWPRGLIQRFDGLGLFLLIDAVK